MNFPDLAATTMVFLRLALDLYRSPSGSCLTCKGVVVAVHVTAEAEAEAASAIVA